MKRIIAYITIGFVFIQPALAAGGAMWEITVTTTQPAAQPTSIKMTQCMTIDEAKAYSGIATYDKDSGMETDDGECHTKIQVKGKSSIMESTCKSGQTTKIVSEYTDNSLSTISTVTDQDGKTVTKMEGKRLGGC